MSISNPQFEVLASGYHFLEAPRVSPDGTVYYSDLLGKAFYKRSPNGSISTILRDRKWVGGAVLNQDGGLVLSGHGGLLYLNEKTDTQRGLLTHIAGNPIDAINDIEADPHGSLYGGTIDFTAIFETDEAPKPGYFFRLDPPDKITIIRDDVIVSNGIGFGPGNSLLYHSESTVGVWVYDLGADRGLTNRRLFAKLDDCDGLAVDVEGGVWVARFQHDEIIRYRPDAVIDRRIKLPFPSVVSMCFGGSDMTDLYIVTGGKPEDKQAAVIRIRSEIPGLPAFQAKF